MVDKVFKTYDEQLAILDMLSVSEFRRFQKELKGMINNLSKKLHVISIDDVLNCMGFPNNWSDIMQRDVK